MAFSPTEDQLVLASGFASSQPEQEKHSTAAVQIDKENSFQVANKFEQQALEAAKAALF